MPVRQQGLPGRQRSDDHIQLPQLPELLPELLPQLPQLPELLPQLLHELPPKLLPQLPQLPQPPQLLPELPTNSQPISRTALRPVVRSAL